MIGQIDIDCAGFKELFEKDLLELILHFDVSIKLEALCSSVRFVKYSDELLKQCAIEIAKILHKRKEESYELISCNFPSLLSVLQLQNVIFTNETCEDILAVFKDMITNTNKQISTRTVHHSPYVIKQILFSTKVDETVTASLLDLLSKQGQVFYNHLFELAKALEEPKYQKLITPYTIQMLKERDQSKLNIYIDMIGDLLAIAKTESPKSIDDNLIYDFGKAISLKWRLCSKFYAQIPKFALTFSILSYYLNGIIASIGDCCYTQREMMAVCFCKLVVHAPNRAEFIKSFIAKYSNSCSSNYRQIFMKLIEVSSCVVSKKFFLEFFYKDFVKHENETVLSVLFSLCKALKSVLPLFYNEKQYEELFTVFKKVCFGKHVKILKEMYDDLDIKQYVYIDEEDNARMKQESEQLIQIVESSNSKDDSYQPNRYEKKEVFSSRKSLLSGPIKTQRTLKSAKNVFPFESKAIKRKGSFDLKKKMGEKKA